MAKCKPELGYECEVYCRGSSLRIAQASGYRGEKTNQIVLSIREAEHLLANLPAVIQDAKDGGPYDDEDSEDETTEAAASGDTKSA